jgi:hypothetical protein
LACFAATLQVPTSARAAPPEVSVKKPRPGKAKALPALEDLNALAAVAGTAEMDVTVEGPGEPSYPSNTPCAYFEWAYGAVNAEGRWSEYSVGYQHKAPVTLRTPHGTVTVEVTRLRTHLRPLWQRTFTPAQASEAPEAVRADVAQSPDGLTVAEYGLVVGRVYRARVHVESFHLPPRGPEGRPGKGNKTLLLVSDGPLTPAPQVPVTPAYQGWSF